MAQKDNEKDNKPEKKSKNVFEKGAEKDIFCTNISIEDLRNLNDHTDNSIYFLKKAIVRHSGKNERIFIGKVKSNNGEVECISETNTLKPKYHQSIVKEYINSVKEYCNELNLIFSDEIEVTTSYRLVIGLGNPSVTETSMLLHKVYGIPYIPGQALKGIMRIYFLERYFNIEKKEFYKIKISNKECNSGEVYKFIFGDDIYGEDSQKGNVIFFDSFPIGNEITIEKDVMTPHYGDYYAEGKNPTDAFNTNPITFYTMKNTKFNFMFALSKKEINVSENEFIDCKNLKEFVLELIQDALEEHGIGAKTSVGYGYFNIDREEIKQRLEKQKQNDIEEQKKQEKLKIKQEEEEKFKEATKDMSEFQMELYKIDIIKDENEKNRILMEFYNENIDKLGEHEQKQLAGHIKNYLQSIGKWKYKASKKDKLNKNSERVKKICEILEIDLP